MSDVVRFTLDGVEMTGRRGDTIASALLRNGRVRVADSTYAGRPRGIFAAGRTEPHALVGVTPPGGVTETMLQATAVEITEGLEVTLLRGRGALDPRPDAARFDHRHTHADVAVVGAGPAGLAAALAAARAGARTILLDDGPRPGGGLLDDPAAEVDGIDAHRWAARAAEELDAAPDVRRLTRTTVVGSYDANYLVAVERRTAHLDAPPPGATRERVWHVRAQQVVLATGAHERPLVFANNDRPGIMLAGAVRTYLNRYRVDPAAAGLWQRAVLATTDDSAYALAHDLLDRGRVIAVVVDARENTGPAADALAARGVRVRAGWAPVHTAADDDGMLAAVTVAPLRADGSPSAVEAETHTADVLAVCGGWSPALQLHSQRQDRLGWSDELGAFAAEHPVAGQHTAGAVSGGLDLRSALVTGTAAGAAAATAAGFPPRMPAVAPRAAPAARTPARPLWLIPPLRGAGPDPSPEAYRHHFVDLQRDQTVADVMRALGTGMRSVEHIKRFTTITTAHDQGRTSSLELSGIVAQLRGAGSVADVGMPVHRPPYTPVAFAALAGRRRGLLYDPVRTTPIHESHVAQGAVFEDVGQFKRPRYYPAQGEDMATAVLRECAAVREGVGIMDASTLGKIDIRGRDAGTFLDRVYTNRFSNLAPGRARYGVMCGLDGMILDDGVTIRTGEHRYLMTTTTGGAATVLDWLEEWLQTEWPELDVMCTSVTEQYATIAVAGPRSREVVAALAPDLDVSRHAFAFMDSRETVLGSGIPARVSRISFSGELAFEVAVPAWHGRAVWDELVRQGEAAGITPYGTEAMHVLRAEKGFLIIGQDTDGTVSPQDAGLGWMVTPGKDFLGRRSQSRPDTMRPDRKQLVSLLPADPALVVPEGAALIDPGDAGGAPPVPIQGWVTSSYRSAALGRSFALGLVVGGRARIGETVLASFDGRTADVVITTTPVLDPEGRRRDG